MRNDSLYYNIRVANKTHVLKFSNIYKKKNAKFQAATTLSPAMYKLMISDVALTWLVEAHGSGGNGLPGFKWRVGARVMLFGGSGNGAVII